MSKSVERAAIRVTGLVRLARDVTREWPVALPARRRAMLRLLRGQLESLDAQLGRFDATPAQLPRPSRHAYGLLRRLIDLGPGHASPPTPRTRAAPRPADAFDALLDYASQPGARRQRIRDELTRWLAGHPRPPASLGGLERWARRHAWVELLVDEAWDEPWIRAARRVREQLARRRAEPTVRIGPYDVLCRLRRERTGVLLTLPAGVVTFDDDGLAAIVDLALGRRAARREVIERLFGPEARRLHQHLLSLEPRRDYAAGEAWDLLDVLREATTTLGQARAPAVRVAWSRSRTRRQMGSYDFASDTIRLSRSLDDPAIEPRLLAYVMHHELLHRRFGLTWSGPTGRAHTAAFRAAEARFPDAASLDRQLNRVAASVR